MSDLSERMRQMVDHYQTEMPQDPLSVEETVADAERFLCDGVGGSCVSLMKRVLELEERVSYLSGRASDEVRTKWLLRSDLEELARHCEKHAAKVIEEIDGGPAGGYGPRVWLRFGRKKRALAAAREIQAEASLWVPA